MTFLTDKQYTEAQGLRCPACHKKTAEATGMIESNGGRGYQSCNCGTCGAEWVDEYRLVGYTDLAIPEAV